MKKIANPSDIKDSEIKRLMLAAPSIPYFKCRSIMETLSSSSIDEKTELVKWLEEKVRLYKETITDIDTEIYDEMCNDVKERISDWESQFGAVTLEDIAFMIESTDIRLTDVAWNRFSPNALASILDNYIIGQDNYKQALGLVIYNHLLHQINPSARLHKMNLLVVGPSGAGKTYGIKTLAEKLNATVVIVNCNTLVQEGIVGSSLSNALTQGLGSDKEKKYIIIVLDEFDKLFVGSGCFNERVVQELLNWLDNNNSVTFAETFRSSSDFRTISSNNITCVLCGKFDSLKSAVQKRMNLNTLGFNASQVTMTDDELYNNITMEDLKTALGNDEICGRINKIVTVDTLNKQQLVDVLLESQGSIYQELKTYFNLHGADFVLTRDAADAIADYAYEHLKNLGVRGLESVAQQVAMHEMMNVDKYHGKTITKTRSDVEKSLKNL